MLQKMMNKRSLSLLGWTVITIISLVFMPNMDDLVREKGKIQIPDTTQSEQAAAMLRQMEDNSAESHSIVAVFNSGGDQPLTEGQLQQVHDVIIKLEQRKDELGITDLLSYLDSKEAASQLISKDQTTILTRMSVDKSTGTISEIAERLQGATETEGVITYLTGNSLVMDDFVKSTQSGIQKTEIIAVIFILVILIVIFRSPIVPLISLLSVGVSYLVSMGLVAQLVDKFGFPFSNFTQVFLVVILFGIGTDYNILLFNRFKEEMSKQPDILTAIKQTYKTAGRTVLFSGLAVFIGFLVLILAEFQIYRASSAVAIGVGVLIAVLYTLNPFFMALLGKKLFWPSKKLEGHNDNRLWGMLSKQAVKRPFIALLIVALLCAPWLISYSNHLNYNDLLEVDDSYASKQGVSVIEDHYSAGFSSPTTVMIRANQRLDNNESLQLLDELAKKISKVDGVASVYTATRPVGEKLEKLYISDQTSTLYNGLDDAITGVNKIHDGLSSAGDKLQSSDTSGLADVQKLIDGTGTIKQGAVDLQVALQQLSTGIDSGATGATELKKGLTQVSSTMQTLTAATGQLVASYNQLEAGLSPIGSAFSMISQAIEGARAGYEQIEQTMTAFVKQHPDLAEDKSIQTTLAISSSAKTKLAGLTAQLTEFAGQYEAAMTGFNQANASLTQVDGGLTQLQNGVRQLEAGASSLEKGLQEGATGSKQIATRSGGLESGLTEVNAGQKQLLDGLNKLEVNLDKLRTGLKDSTTGLTEVSEGLTDARTYLSELSGSEAAMKFYIPQEILEGKEFQRSLDMYMSKDRTLAQLNVILDVNPYTVEAIDIIHKIEQQTAGVLDGSHLEGAQLAIGGKSSQNADLQGMSSGDFARTAVFMLLGIGLVLIIITRSFWQPVFIISSLLLACGAALGLTELLGKGLLGVDKIGWNVPFFSFIMIVALGVDYSIFMMMRYREQDGQSGESIVNAARQIGGVVISAAIILGGTFAALIPSGILTLIEVAIAVIIGLLLLSFVMLPVFIPALMAISRKLGGK